MLFCEITKLRNHEIAKSVTRILVSRHLINWFVFVCFFSGGRGGMGDMLVVRVVSCELLSHCELIYELICELQITLHSEVI